MPGVSGRAVLRFASVRSKSAVVALNVSSGVGVFLTGEALDCVRSSWVRLESAHDCEDRLNAGESSCCLAKGLTFLAESSDVGGFLEKGVRRTG